MSFENENVQNGQNGQIVPMQISAIYDQLPDLMKQLLEIHTNEGDKRLALLGSLAIMSGLIPKVYTKYGQAKLYCNLYFYAVGSAGSGKGALTQLRRLVDPIVKQTGNVEKLKELQNTMPEGIAKMLDDVIDQRKNWIIPANSSSAGFLQLLNENNGEGILFETEGDTITNMLKSEYGNYSDMMRKAYHHEPITQYRKGDQKLIEITHPRLSICISSTPKQLFRFIPDAENGLMSRFMFHAVESDPKFRNLFEEGDGVDAEQRILEVGKELLALRNRIKKLDNMVFKLTKEQQDKFHGYFSKQKSVVTQFVGEELDASVHRMAVNFLRISMLLSVLRIAEGDDLPEVVECADVDFEITLAIVESLFESLNKVVGMMPNKELAGLPENKLGFYVALPEGEFEPKDVIPLGKQYELPEKNVRRFLNDRELFRKVRHGVYCKKVA